jgi:hypothetical protein
MAVAGELKVDPQPVLALRDQLLDVVADARRLAEECVCDRVDYRRLAGTCVARDREQVEAGEVYLRLLPVRGEALYLELNRPQRTPPRTGG